MQDLEFMLQAPVTCSANGCVATTVAEDNEEYIITKIRSSMFEIAKSTSHNVLPSQKPHNSYLRFPAICCSQIHNNGHHCCICLSILRIYELQKLLVGP